MKASATCATFVAALKSIMYSVTGRRITDLSFLPVVSTIASLFRNSFPPVLYSLVGVAGTFSVLFGLPASNRLLIGRFMRSVHSLKRALASLRSQSDAIVLGATSRQADRLSHWVPHWDLVPSQLLNTATYLRRAAARAALRVAIAFSICLGGSNRNRKPGNCGQWRPQAYCVAVLARQVIATPVVSIFSAISPTCTNLGARLPR